MANEDDSSDTGEEINFHLTDAPTEKSNEEEKAEVLEKDVEVVKDAKTPDSQAIQLRIPYNNGYGDFCFGRWANRPQKSLWTGGPLDQACWERESCGAIVPELDGFQRVGAFPFFKLPREVRDRVYRLLLAPLYQYSKTATSSYICVQVQPPLKPYTDLFDHGFQHFMDRGGSEWPRMPKGAYDHIDYLFTPSKQIEPPRPTIQEFEERKAAHNHKYASHPSRTTCYEVKLSPTRTALRQTGCSTDELYLEWLRNLSNVSNVVRRELGNIFWNRISIDARADNTSVSSDISSFGKFLDDRPLVHKHIICLRLQIELQDFNESRNMLDGTGIPELNALCHKFGHRLALEKLSVEITISNETLPDILQSNFLADALRATRNLKVSDVFTIEPMILSGFSDIFAYEPAQGESGKLMEEKCKKVFRDIMLPDTLRLKPPTDEMSAYLESRSESTSTTRSPSPAPVAWLL